MRQVFLEKGLITIKNVAEPFLDDNLILVSVMYSCISPGTETSTIAQSQASILSNAHQKLNKILQALSIHGFSGTKALIQDHLAGSLLALGYSCTGTVIAVGKKITGFKAGDFVACAGAQSAYHAEIVAVPENLVVLIKSKELLKQASLTTLGAIALQGIRRAKMQLGETVAVIGLGILGQLTIVLAKAAGLRVVACDIRQDRLETARISGADFLCNTQEDFLPVIDQITQRYGVDCTIITASAQHDEILQQATLITRKKGKVIIVGDVNLSCKRSPFYEKELDIMISCSYGPGRYDAAYELQGKDYPYAYVRWTENRNMQAFIDMLDCQKISVTHLIKNEYDIEQAQDAYNILLKKNAVCALLKYQEKNALIYNTVASEARTPTQYKPSSADIIRIGMIGSGGFSKTKLLPILKQTDAVSIKAIVDTSTATAIKTARLYGAAKALTDDKELFNEDLVDAVIIASPHTFHAAQALRALQNGKAVFLEKPMVTTMAQLSEMMDFLYHHQHIPFCVDYNRSFSPFMQKIKKQIVDRKGPLIIHYRMNAGFIPKDHWIQSDIGAGRIIGEACHIFDVFSYLTDGRPLSVSVETIKTTRDDLFATDNFSVQFSFSDGSLCSLLYTSLGHQDISKEYMEIFYDGKTIILDDYKTLMGSGLSSSFNEKSLQADKGHKRILEEFFFMLKKELPQPLISLERLEQVAQMTLMVDALANKGGGFNEFLV